MRYALAGIRPTGGPHKLHLGHWFSSLLPLFDWTAESTEHESRVMVAHFHAPDADLYSSHRLHVELSAILENIVVQKYGTAVRSRLKVIRQEEICTIKVFSEFMNIVTTNKLLDQVTAKQLPLNGLTAHTLLYPVMQAVDCLGYDEIFVGPDQLPNMDLVRDLIARANSAYGKGYYEYFINVFKELEYKGTIPRVHGSTYSVRDLRDPSLKMSKSNSNGCIFLFEPSDSIRKKIKSAVTDEAGLANLHRLYRLFCDPVKNRLDGTDNEAMKFELAEGIIRYFEPHHRDISREGRPHG